MNVERAKQVLELIEAHPDNFSMQDFFSGHGWGEAPAPTLEYVVQCGSTCCIGGWCAVLAGPELRDEIEADVCRGAQLWLEIGEDEAAWLFYHYSHDSKRGLAYFKACVEAGEVLDLFDWATA